MGSMSPDTTTQQQTSSTQAGLYGPSRDAINARAPGDIAYLNALGGSAPTSLPGLTANGFYPAQENAFAQAINYGLTKSSGDYGQRGFVSPENRAAIAASAAQNVMPQFAPLISANYQQQELLGQSRFEELRKVAELYKDLLGQTSTGQGTLLREGPGLGYNAINMSNQAGANTAQNWGSMGSGGGGGGGIM